MKRTQAIEPREEIAAKGMDGGIRRAGRSPAHLLCGDLRLPDERARQRKLEGMLTQMGMTPAANREEADFVIFNTCRVRDNAQRRALGNVVWLKELKKNTSGIDGRRLRLHDAAAGDGRADSQAISVCGSGLRHA
ncbi:MAG: hypothetical protein ACLUI3_02995 [Christensenellales bacterium]